MRFTLPIAAAFFGLLANTAIAGDIEDGKLVIDVTHKVECSRKTRSGDVIDVHYTGKFTDGIKFDSSVDRNQPFHFILGAGQVIPGWDQGLLDMCPGEKRTLTIPYQLAYGEHGRPPVIPAKSTLIFTTELIAIEGVTQQTVENPIGGSSEGPELDENGQVKVKETKEEAAAEEAKDEL
ncbi:hypothetical protein BJ508DRAFT_223872 [Ascobolus immersus RN42]|uniref:peptidylprolyl isomerase n=1 Tax=Ascobolus immersus RN42 TaxID=1160509 RepID=A0A3N4IBG6_ASCIM|nr:hypothetical protein BJ508DRAFT_223872 [Ascobolus immersus RN42]